MSRAVRAAMVSASVGNVMACLSLDEGCGAHWTSAPVADVHNVLDELERLQAVEERIKELIEYRGKSRTGALMMQQKARDQNQVEDYLKWDKCAEDYRREINVLEGLLNG